MRPRTCYRPTQAIPRPCGPRSLSRQRCQQIARAGWDPRKFNMGESGDMPYEYDDKELQELADLMPPPLEAHPLPSSKIEMKRLLDKHGVRCDATFGTDFEERVREHEAKQKASFSDWTDTRPDFDSFLVEGESKDDEDAAWLEEEISEAEAHVMQLAEFGYECMREAEAAEIFEKAMELHHSQRERSRNIYASCMWYAKKLEAAELQDNYEMADKNPIPTFLRAFYTLEEEFDELNKKQIDVERKMEEHTRAIEEAEFREFLRGTVVNMPTRPGDEYHEIFAPVDRKATEAEKEEPELDIDVYLHSILPNAESDKGMPKVRVKSKDAYLNELIFKEDEMD